MRGAIITKKVFVYVSIALAFLLITSCPRPPDPAKERDVSIYLELVDYWTTSVTLKLSVADSTLAWDFILSRNDSIVHEGRVNRADTIIIDHNLIPSTDYSYTASLIENGEIMNSSSKVDLATRRTEEFLGLENMHVLELRIFQNYLYAGTWNGGLWKYDLDGDYFTWVYLGLSSTDLGYEKYYITDILHNSNEILVTGKTDSQLKSGLFKSQDGGANWYSSHEGLEYGHPQDSIRYYSIQKFQQNEDKVLALCKRDSGITLKTSIDFGENWESDSNFTSLRGTFTDIHIFQKHKYFDTNYWVAGNTVWMEYLLSKSIDGGLNWDAFDIPGISPYYSSIAPHPADTDIIYISSSYPGSIVKAVDGGNAWINSSISVIPIFLHPYSDEMTSIIIDNDNPDHLYCAGGKYIFQTFDAGSTWIELDTSFGETVSIKSIVYSENRSQLVVSTTEGIYVLN